MADGNTWATEQEGQNANNAWDYLAQVWGANVPSYVDTLSNLAVKPL